MNLYKTMFERRAVRNFEKTTVDSSVIQEIEKYIHNVKQMDGAEATFKIINNDSVGGKAPYYVLAYCEDTLVNYINIGYVLEKIDLYIQSIGMGSLWLGMAKPKEKEEKSDDFCIMLAFGLTSVSKRKNESDFSRLDILELSEEDNKIARAVRLAPTSMNSQPYKLRFNENKVIINYFGRGLFKIILKYKFNKIDIGIVTRFVETALINEGKMVNNIIVKEYDDDFSVVVEYN